MLRSCTISLRNQSHHRFFPGSPRHIIMHHDTDSYYPTAIWLQQKALRFNPGIHGFPALHCLNGFYPLPAALTIMYRHRIIHRFSHIPAFSTDSGLHKEPAAPHKLHRQNLYFSSDLQISQFPPDIRPCALHFKIFQPNAAKMFPRICQYKLCTQPVSVGKSCRNIYLCIRRFGDKPKPKSMPAHNIHRFIIHDVKTIWADSCPFRRRKSKTGLSRLFDHSPFLTQINSCPHAYILTFHMNIFFHFLLPGSSLPPRFHLTNTGSISFNLVLRSQSSPVSCFLPHPSVGN